MQGISPLLSGMRLYLAAGDGTMKFQSVLRLPAEPVQFQGKAGRYDAQRI